MTAPPPGGGDARAAILRAVGAARHATFGAHPTPPLPALPDGPWRHEPPEASARRFVDAARAAAWHVEEGRRADLPARMTAHLAERFPASATGGRPLRIVSTVADVPGTVALPQRPHALYDLDVLACEGVLGVAESGAIWLPASRLGERAAVVLAQHVLVLLSRAAIVPDLHAAYAAVSVADEPFGLFLAGPSKTADIEQSLVIGAHGATSAAVLLVE